MTAVIGSVTVFVGAPPLVEAPPVAPPVVPGRSARYEPRSELVVDGVLVVWSQERGWTCAVDYEQPCSHTVNLAAPGLQEV